MANDLGPKNWNLIFIVIISVVLIGTCLFAIYSFREKQLNIAEQRELEKINLNLKQQMEIVKSKTNFLKSDTTIFDTARIYKSVAENANRYQIRVKGYTPTNDTNDLLITLIGTYPKAIYFFEGLYQQKLGNLKKIEIKKYEQEPKASVEILMTLTTSQEGGKAK